MARLHRLRRRRRRRRGRHLRRPRRPKRRSRRCLYARRRIARRRAPASLSRTGTAQACPTSSYAKWTRPTSPTRACARETLAFGVLMISAPVRRRASLTAARAQLTSFATLTMVALDFVSNARPLAILSPATTMVCRATGLQTATHAASRRRGHRLRRPRRPEIRRRCPPHLDQRGRRPSSSPLAMILPTVRAAAAAARMPRQ